MDRDGQFSSVRSGSSAGIANGNAAPGVLRHAAYMVLMFVRVPLRLISSLVLWPLVGFGVFWGLAAGWSSPACLWMIGSGIGLFVAGFIFDTILLWVAPEPLHLES